ncbi:TIGR03086 family metal-binding protein [Streptomyces sp. NBC_00083]|uniref:TIGR03086 family metal-binding protein n=1 Tax=Streptomyces sp. NBC_00083 TaxID=2975647 RepID=UPI00224D6866|nr:TIGR03086 family metal-binding protein [Streptomyces sp. NBC_00083]MCX5386439.1 TIGR03086 family metal-binding protein [Streptomyces sp. NBC_00083]
MSDDTNTPAHPDLGAAAAELTRLLDGVRDDQLAGPTPCPAYPVRDLLAHVLGLSRAFQDAARKETGPSTGTAPGTVAPPELPDDWRSALPKHLAAMAEAWRDPAAWEGETQIGGLRLPAAVTGRVGLDELVVHGWDVAVSTGQAYRPAPADLEVSYAFLAPSKDDPAARGTAFGPAVEVPDGAPMLDRVIGVSGRDPGWAG